MTTSDSTRTRAEAPQASGPAATALRRLRAQGIRVGVWAFNTWARLAHRLGSGPRLAGLDHVTIPCRDLRVAEDFYVGLLGARVMMRVDAAFLRKVGRPADADAGAIHTSIVFSGGARLDLFIQPDGQPPPRAGHPHHALAVAPGAILRWKKRLNDAGVPTFGPTRLGPPGQASLYFNDPFGNHLELVTHGFVPDIPVGAPDMGTLEYDWKAA